MALVGRNVAPREKGVAGQFFLLLSAALIITECAPRNVVFKKIAFPALIDQVALNIIDKEKLKGS